MLETINQFNKAITNFAHEDGFTPTHIDGVGVFKSSKTRCSSPALYDPIICLIGQGEKVCNVGDSSFIYRAGDFFINCLPMPVGTQVAEASSEKPLLAVGLRINLVRLADMVLKIEQLERGRLVKNSCESSCVVVGKADVELVKVFNKLMLVGTNKVESAILGESIVDEIYYRILTGEHGYALRALLNQYGQIQPISKVIDFIHKNMERSIYIEELAEIANMSKTTFFNAFKKLMHVPPMQYVKSYKLQKAQVLLKQGMQANEASFYVGYNSFSQFSREYKRFFGFSPSKTKDTFELEASA
jgi:AraC-like DNA-binding protein